MKRELIKDAGVLSCFFLFVLWLDTRLIYMVTAPGFQVRRDFLFDSLRFPGGLADLFAAALGQLLYFRLPGALALTALAGLLLLLSNRVLARLTPGRRSFARYVPLLSATAMLSTYFFALQSLFAVLILLFLAWIWVRLARIPAPVRFVALALLSALLFFSSVGMDRWWGPLEGGSHFRHRVFPVYTPQNFSVLPATFLLTGWVLFCLYFELCSGRLSGWRGRARMPWLPASALAAPLLGLWHYSFRISPAFELPFVPFWQIVTSLAMYGSVGLMIAFLFVSRYLPRIPPLAALRKKTEKLKASRGVRVSAAGAPAVLLLGAGMLTMWSPVSGSMPSHAFRRKLRVGHLVRVGRYEAALAQARPAGVEALAQTRVGGVGWKPTRTYRDGAGSGDVSMDLGWYSRGLALDVNLALHKTGRMLEEVCAWPQPSLVTGGLFMPIGMRHTDFAFSVYDYGRKADTLMRLGRLNDAEHMAYEMMARVRPGYRPDLFWRLAVIHMVKDEPAEARIYLNNLSADPVHRRAARRYLQTLDEDPGLEGVPEISRWRDRMLVEDDVAQTVFMEGILVVRQLENLLDRNPANRMALDYYFSEALFRGKWAWVVENIHRLPEAGYRRLPRHVQEAVLVYMEGGGEVPDAVQQHIPPRMASDWQLFNSLATAYTERRDARVLNEMMTRFGNTYWFYLFEMHLRGRSAAGGER